MKTTPRVARIISGFISVSRRRPKSFQLEPCFQAGCFKSNEFVALLILSRRGFRWKFFKIKKPNSPVYSLSLLLRTSQLTLFLFVSFLISLWRHRLGATPVTRRPDRATVLNGLCDVPVIGSTEERATLPVNQQQFFFFFINKSPNGLFTPIVFSNH